MATEHRFDTVQTENKLLGFDPNAINLVFVHIILILCAKKVWIYSVLILPYVTIVLMPVVSYCCLQGWVTGMNVYASASCYSWIKNRVWSARREYSSARLKECAYCAKIGAREAHNELYFVVPLRPTECERSKRTTPEELSETSLLFECLSSTLCNC